MRIVITGASGNVGSALLRRLGEGPDHEVVGVARRRPGPGAPFDRVDWWPLDLTGAGAGDRLREAFHGADAVVHLAWGFQPTHDEAHLEELAVGGTRRVLDAVAGAGVAQLVHMSSVGAYSPRRSDHPVDETWPTEGVPTSAYSRHKAAAERLLDTFGDEHPGIVLTRMRPGLIGQRAAGSSLLRYVLPAVVPSRLLGAVPLLPLDRRLAVPMVHADDVADAITRALERRAGGAFNLAAPPAITVDDIAHVLGARHVHVPAGALRALVRATWRARLQPVDEGWLDLAYAVPLLDAARAREDLGWEPRADALDVLAETVAGMREAAAAPSPVLRRRTLVDGLRRFATRGPVARRAES